MGYEMYRQLTYTCKDKPHDSKPIRSHSRSRKRKPKKEPLENELANIIRCRN